MVVLGRTGPLVLAFAFLAFSLAINFFRSLSFPAAFLILDLTVATVLVLCFLPNFFPLSAYLLAGAARWDLPAVASFFLKALSAASRLLMTASLLRTSALSAAALAFNFLT